MKGINKYLVLFSNIIIIILLATSCSGLAGVNVTDANVNGSGHLILELSNGQTIDAGSVQGSTSAQGPAGSNMIKAMGNVNNDGSISQAYNVTSVTWNETIERWEIKLTGINFNHLQYVVCVSAVNGFARYNSDSGMLIVYVFQNQGYAKIKSPFSFTVMALP